MIRTVVRMRLRPPALLEYKGNDIDYLRGQDVRMRLNIAGSILILLLATASIGGATMAWFIGESHGNTSAFTAGIVTISEPVIQNDQNWQSGQCEPVQWSIFNYGSKKAYIRVLPTVQGASSEPIYIASHVSAGSETAWVGEPEGPTIPSGPNWNRYFIYHAGCYTEDNPYIQKILAGSNQIEIGSVEVWDDGEKLYMRYNLYNTTTDEIHVYAGMNPPTHHAPGQLGFSYYFSPGVSTFDFQKEYIFDKQGGNAEVAIKEILSVENAGLSWEICPEAEGEWFEGNDGWWYYGVGEELTEIAPSEEVTVCFLLCIDENYDGAVEFFVVAEAVQSSNNAVDNVWPGR